MTPHVVTVHLASPIHSKQEIPPLVIEAREVIPDLKDMKDIEEYRALYVAEAKSVVAALCQHLSGGLIDQILIELLTRKASLWRIPFDEGPPASADAGAETPA